MIYYDGTARRYPQTVCLREKSGPKGGLLTPQNMYGSPGFKAPSPRLSGAEPIRAQVIRIIS